MQKPNFDEAIFKVFVDIDTSSEEDPGFIWPLPSAANRSFIKALDSCDRECQSLDNAYHQWASLVGLYEHLPTDSTAVGTYGIFTSKQL